MLKKLSIMLLSSAQKIKYPLFLQLCHYLWPVMQVYCCVRPFTLMFQLQIALLLYVTVFHSYVHVLKW